MTEWWEGLSLLGRIFTCIAVPATAVMILQTILVLCGMGGGTDGDLDGDLDPDADFDADFDTDLDTDFDGDLDADLDVDSMDPEAQEAGGDAPEGSYSLRLFSIRGIVAFFSIGGWAGLAAERAGIPLPGTITLAVAAGAAALFAVAWVMKKAMELQEDGTMDLRCALGKTGSVYLPIPPKGQGKGKIQLLLSGSLVELEAVNTGEKMIPTGSEVMVCALVDANTLAVESLFSRKERGREEESENA